MRRFLILTVAFFFAATLTAQARVYRLGHVVNEKDAFHVAAVKFKELVEKRSKGRIKIQIYPNAQLGDERTLLEGLQMGSVDFAIITSGPISNFAPKFAVVDMPFLFKDAKTAYRILDGPIGKDLLKELEKANLKGLAFAERGFRNLTNNKRPIYKPSDVKGLKIRVMQNPVYVDTFRALGANAVPMAWGDCLTALQQGTIDGQENPINVIYAFKIYETQKYLAMTRHTYAPAVIMMGLNLWKQFSPADQKLLVECAQEAAEYERAWDAAQEAKQLKFIEKQGMIVTYPDIKAFRAAVKPVYDKYRPKFGDYLDRILKAVNQ